MCGSWKGVRGRMRRERELKGRVGRCGESRPDAGDGDTLALIFPNIHSFALFIQQRKKTTWLDQE